MLTDLEPRLVEAARAAQVPNQDACNAIRRLHARGVRTAVICCTQRRLLGPQLEALEREGVPIDALVTADEACEPAPAPWGIFEAVRLLGIDGTGDLTLLDDCDDGVRAAQNVGAIAISVRTEGGNPATGAAGAIHFLDEVGSSHGSLDIALAGASWLVLRFRVGGGKTRTSLHRHRARVRRHGGTAPQARVLAS